jgi:uncharacterized protein YgiM (DUF1202 family)
MAKHNAKGAVYGITAALVFTAVALPAAASPLLFHVGEAQSAAVSDETFGLGYDLEAMIITTVEQDQRSLYANKGICVADEFTGIMTKPDESSELVGKLYKDAGCEILEAKDGWTKVKSGSCEGYVASQQLITGVEAEEYALKNGVTQLIVKAQESGKEVTLYAEPSNSANVVTTVKDEQSVTVVSQMADNGWTEVSIGSDKGYLNNASVVFDIKYDTAVSVEEEAKALAEAEAEAEAAAEEEVPVQEEESTTPEVEAETEEPAEEEPVAEAEAEPAEEVTISDVDETVWATTAVNVRTDYSTSSDSLGVLGGGYSIPRTGIVSNGWSRVLYDGETAYIQSEFLTTEQPAVSGDTEINETVYTTTAVNVRQAASTSSEILGLAEAGTKFTRTMESGAWSRIKYDGQDAYIKSEFLTTTAPETAQEPEPEPEPEPEQPAVSDGVTEWYDTVWATTTVNIRSGAGTSYSWVGMLYAGDSIERTGKTDNGWSRVNYNGQTAYINSDYLTTEEPTVQSGSQDTSVGSSSSSDTYSLGQEIANFALQFVGYPYVYGGNSLTGGVDCSGFAQQVYLHFGYSITRTAQAQAGDGTPVSIDSLQPGDLVFYADDDGSIGHVTIYIGGGQVVHASNPSNGIMVSDMYYRTPVWAVRII